MVIGRADSRNIGAVWTIAVIRRGAGNIWSGPRITREKSGNHGIRRAAIRSDLGGIRNARLADRADIFVLPFIIQKEKCFVSHDRPAKRASVLVVRKGSLRRVVEIEVVPGARSGVTEKFDAGAVQRI